MSSQPVYFWRPDEQPYGIFSQWYDSPFEVDGVMYQSTEMWMMIQKAKLFGDEEIAQQMMQTKDPRKHRDMGRKAKGFDGKKWDENKSRIVEEGNYHKFTKAAESETMLKILLDTGDQEIVEASPSDSIWGVGFSASKADANRDKWGQNLLGKVIMNVRDQLRKENDA